MILFFDTETTGFPHTTKPDDHPAQPHIVELAANLTDDEGKFVAGFSSIIDPGVERGVRIPEHVVKIHGIDEEKCWRYGLPADQVLYLFGRLWDRADLVVAHRVEFDIQMLKLQVSRTRPPIPFWENSTTPQFCTQTAAKARLGSGSNLADCYRTFFSEDLVGHHGAAADAAACQRIYFHLKSIGAA